MYSISYFIQFDVTDIRYCKTIIENWVHKCKWHLIELPLEITPKNCCKCCWSFWDGNSVFFWKIWKFMKIFYWELETIVLKGSQVGSCGFWSNFFDFKFLFSVNLIKIVTIINYATRKSVCLTFPEILMVILRILQI